MTVSLARIIVSVSSLDSSLAFYQGVLGLEPYYVEAPLARLRSGSLDVMLHQRGAEASDLGVAVSFAVDDVDAATAAAASLGLDIIDEPADQPWGERQSVVRDPDGHVVCLVRAL